MTTTQITTEHLFQGTVANGATQYVEVPIRAGALGVHVAWKDATSSATITLEFTSYPRVAAVAVGQAWEWKDSGLTFTGPSGVAAGALLVNVENIRQQRARLKIVGAAACSFEIWDGTTP